MYKLFIVCILGMIEGLTEFLPISSTGHRVLFGNLLGFTVTDEFFKTFLVTIQLGSILSIIILFWNKIYNMGAICLKNIFILKYCQENHLCIKHILVGSFPGIIFGMLFYEKIGLIFEPIYIIYGLIVGSLFLLIGESYIFRFSYISNINDITYLQAFFIGCFQCLAFWPGFSRCGVTIGAGLLVGLNKRVALEFSFFLSIPVIIGAIILTIYYQSYVFNLMNSLLLCIGCIISFIVSLFTMRFFLNIIQKISLVPFVIYRLLLAAGIYYIFIY